MTEEAGAATDHGMPAIRVTMMPRDTNAHGTIFGGTLLAYLDQAGAIATRPYCGLVVTVKMTEVVFHQPVFVGDIVSFYSRVTRFGRTSITVRVVVEAERWRDPSAKVTVTDAEIVYVNVDENRRPVPIDVPVGAVPR
jgi:acyl-CoA thioesterase YciA